MVTQPPYRKPLIVSMVLHVVVFLILALGFQFTGVNYVVENNPNTPIINAMVMNIPQAMPPMPTPVQPVAKPVIPAPQPVKQPPPSPKPQVTPQKDAIALNVKKRNKQQEQIEKQLLADLKKTQKQEKTAKQKALEQAFASELKNLAAKKPQSTNSPIEGDKEQKSQGQVDKYKALVLQVISRHWLIPSSVDKRLATKLIIYLAPGGMVLDVDIYESSGNPALDSSARAAVFKASPLPVPSDPEGFKFFKRFVLTFRPINFQS